MAKKAKVITPESDPTTFAAFYSKALDKVEKETRIYSNNVTFVDRLSSGILVYDWVNGGGILPGMCSIAGPEASGKTTTEYHVQASGILANLPINAFWDAERTLNPKLAGRIWDPFGLDFKKYLDKPELGFRYYRHNVIEKLFDYMVKMLNTMPDKAWQPDAQAWSYIIPKRDEYFKRLMDSMGLKADRNLTNEHEYICLTDNAKAEGLFCLDGFAAMLTNDTEEKEAKSGRRAEEASAFSLHLRRVAGKLVDKQFIMLGTNQLRDVPGQTYGDPHYEPGGNAIKFYSSMRCRITSRAVMEGFERDKDNGSFCKEQSVEGDGTDRYAFKAYKNTKNKYGIPGLSAHARVWVSDRNGNPRGFDPVFDVLQHLLNTKQVVRKAGKLKFKLNDTIGKKTARMLNDSSPCGFDTLKRLVLSETTGRRDLLKQAAKELGINADPKLRSKLFAQMKVDESLWSVTENLKAKKEATDYEEL